MKFRLYYHILNKWLYLKNHNHKISSHKSLDGKKTAIYGFGDLGKRFVEELENEGICITYVIDKKDAIWFTPFPIYSNYNFDMMIADVIVITPFYEYEIIRNEIEKHFYGEIVSLEDIINDLWKDLVI